MRRLLLVVLVLSSVPLIAADTWQYGRIKDVRKSVTTKTKAWVVNTPINEDQITYTISVHVLDKILAGNYELQGEESAPPPEWTANYAVKVQVVGDTMYLRGPTGEAHLRITQRKNAGPMQPLTAEEKKQLAEMEAAPRSLIGFSEDSKTTSTTNPAPEAAPQPPPPPSVGSVTVRSTPYLSEVFVDGDSMGYTPAKINLAPGKHTFRVEKSGYKPWTKEIMITVGSELTLDASLERR